MKTMMTALAALTLVAGATACSKEPATEAAASSGEISGTWKADPSTALAENDESDFVLTNGEFTCNSCLPPYSYSANGEWQKVDRPGADEVKMEVVDDKTVKTAFRFEGRDLGNSTWTVSEDGNSMAQSFVNLDGDETTEGNLTLVRTAAGPDGSHAMSGKWKLGEYGELSEAGLKFTYSLDGDTLTSTSNDGGWSAVLGGEAVAIEGSESNTMVKAEKTGENSFRETYIRDGETVGVTDVTIDGDTATFVSVDPRDDSKFTFSATRQ